MVSETRCSDCKKMKTCEYTREFEIFKNIVAGAEYNYDTTSLHLDVTVRCKRYVKGEWDNG